MSGRFRPPPRAARLSPFAGPSVWLEFSPLSRLTGALNLGQGAPGWPPPPFLTASLRAAAQSPLHAQYARSPGLPELVREIARVYAARLTPRACAAPRPIDHDTQVLVTVGASQAIYVACTALLDPADEAVLIAPAFDMYTASVRLAGATPVYVPLVPRPGVRGVASSADLVLDMEELRRSISDKTKMLILNSPHNPTGKVFSRDEYVQIAAMLDERAPSCVVLSDEVYEHLVFDGEHVPFASVSESAFERTLSIYSAGKTFSATGLKIGWVIGCPDLVRHLQLLHQYMVFSVNGVSQLAIAEALRIAEEPFNGHDTYYKWLCEEYRRKRDFLVSALREAGMDPISPQGAFYVCTKVPDQHPAKRVPGLPDAIWTFVKEGKLTIDAATRDRCDYNICRNLVTRFGVAAIPNSAFFPAEHIGKTELASDYVRFAFCKPDEALSEAKSKLCSEPQ